MIFYIQDEQIREAKICSGNLDPLSHKQKTVVACIMHTDLCAYTLPTTPEYGSIQLLIDLSTF